MIHDLAAVALEPRRFIGDYVEIVGDLRVGADWSIKSLLNPHLSIAVKAVPALELILQKEISNIKCIHTVRIVAKILASPDSHLSVPMLVLSDLCLLRKWGGYLEHRYYHDNALELLPFRMRFNRGRLLQYVQREYAVSRLISPQESAAVTEQRLKSAFKLNGAFSVDDAWVSASLQSPVDAKDVLFHAIDFNLSPGAYLAESSLSAVLERFWKWTGSVYRGQPLYSVIEQWPLKRPWESLAEKHIEQNWRLLKSGIWFQP